MHQIVNSIASLAALAAISLGLWHNWGLGLTLKKALISYVVVFATCAVMILTIRIIPCLERKSPETAPAGDGGAERET